MDDPDLAERLVPGSTLARRWPLKGGVSADVEAIELALADGATARFVVRRRRAHAWQSIDGDGAAIEFALLEALHGAGFPVPRPVLLGDASDGPAERSFVMDFVDGATAEDAARTEAGLAEMAGFLARLHAQELDALALPPLPRRDDPIPEALTYLPPSAEGSRLRAAIAAAAPFPAPRRPALLHGDFWPGNVLWRGGTLAAVIDWEHAAIGDPMCDLAGARLELLWKCGEAAMATFTDHYRRRAAIDGGRLPYWEVYVAAAGLAYLGEWGLGADVEAQMRGDAASLLARAAAAIGA